ncbi:hypothetical protein GCM10011512_03030 [Tersicoccus solisilvae]|uniref:UDP-glucose 4-epimerase n=1 Tax=Tersicoccus solisilvae TaxID=1882339 RepID=A0ABQ1NPG3_9MICC|nr:DUF779 domain-containing protein [Tersicoccus solisilvae]GGC79786.1 hypothetical protein GCM10011512_03030 [Tersicoccus solisilvae]
MPESAALDARVVVAGETEPRVALSPAAIALLQRLWAQHGPLMFHQSGGCCDGSSPMCYPAGEFLTGDADVLLGVFDLPAGDASSDGGALGELEFWMSVEQFSYWRHTRLLVDVVDGRGSGFSVEAPEGKRFLIRSTLMGT